MQFQQEEPDEANPAADSCALVDGEDEKPNPADDGALEVIELCER